MMSRIWAIVIIILIHQSLGKSCYSFALFHEKDDFMVTEFEKIDCPDDRQCYHEIVRLMESAVWHMGGCDREGHRCHSDRQEGEDWEPPMTVPDDGCTGNQLGSTICCCEEENCNADILHKERPQQMILLASSSSTI